MLELIIPETEFYNASTNKFIEIPECTLTLEHSLISLSKWESKWQIPYFDETKKKTIKQDLDYIRCMVIGNIKNEHVFEALTPNHIDQINEYIAAPMTATTFQKKSRGRGKKEVITAEVIYARMFDHNISMECQKWHLNRLLTLLKVCDLQSGPKEKMSKKQTALWNAEQNAARKAKYNTRG